MLSQAIFFFCNHYPKVESTMMPATIYSNKIDNQFSKKMSTTDT